MSAFLLLLSSMRPFYGQAVIVIRMYKSIYNTSVDLADYCLLLNLIYVELKSSQSVHACSFKEHMQTEL